MQTPSPVVSSGPERIRGECLLSTGLTHELCGHLFINYEVSHVRKFNLYEVKFFYNRKIKFFRAGRTMSSFYVL